MNRLSLADFSYCLPPQHIAQHPALHRDTARLLVFDRKWRRILHSRVADLPRWLEPGDLLVVNETRVLSARLHGRKDSGGRAAATVLGPVDRERGLWRALVACSGRLRTGQRFQFGSGERALAAELRAVDSDGTATLAIDPGCSPYDAGELPLPPYIRRGQGDAADQERYQTLFARAPGSVAAPTAGLHFSHSLLAALAAAGIERTEIVLHVGAGTFRPLRPENFASDRLHSEPFCLSTTAAEAVNRARARGSRVVAIGTTSARVLETCATEARRVVPRSGITELFLRPGSPFRVVDALLTNFHLPRSSLLLLVAAFAGREPILRVYREALRSGYRFCSYGDPMLVL